MSEFGLKEPVPLPFDQVGVEGEYKLTYALLDGVKKKLHGYVFGKELPYKFMYYKQLIADYNAKKISAFDYNTALTEQKNLRLLRNQFLHWSANYDGIGGPFQPNMENNVRKRIPYEG